nr:MAG TPA: hypothetical protein [Bacteriophage sp.]
MQIVFLTIKAIWKLNVERAENTTPFGGIIPVVLLSASEPLDSL